MFIVAYPKRGNGFTRRDRGILFQNDGTKRSREDQEIGSSDRKLFKMGTQSNSIPKQVQTNPPTPDRMVDGVPYQLERLKCLGNALLPQISEFIGIKIMEDHANQLV